MNKSLLILALLASTFANAQQPAQLAKDTAAPNYTIVKRNLNDSIHIDVNKIYQGTTLIGKMASGEVHAGGLSNKTITVFLLNGTKVADAFTETNGDPNLWRISTLKDQQHSKVTTRKGYNHEDVISYLIKGSYL